MFKSIFTKYVTAFMVIITFGFALLLLIVTSIVSNYSAETKAKLMNNAADVTRIFLEEKATEISADELVHIVWSDDVDEALDTMLRSFSEYDSEIAILISDQNGRVIYAVEGSESMVADSMGEQLPPAVHKTVAIGGEFSELVNVSFAERDLWVYATSIRNADGEFCGAVAVCSTNVRWGNTVMDLTRTVLTAAFLVLLAALIAAYFLTERTIAPLREMRTAARDFASGKFDNRLIVRGKDEVAELAKDFNQMAESLESLEKMRNSFVANVSHDLRTPMTTIAGFIDGIRDGVIPPEEHDHYLEVVSMEVHRLSRLVATLLDLSRIQAGDRKFTMKPFDICEMARLILISFEQKIEEKRLDVEFECEEDRILVNADHDAIYQIFYNICHNAVKFSREGGTLRLQLLETMDKKIRVSVYNDGDGIPMEDQAHVFERFYKSDKSRGLDKSGVGLGLYIAKTIIAAHGERIGVTSDPGKNCEFYFTLQRVPPANEESNSKNAKFLHRSGSDAAN